MHNGGIVIPRGAPDIGWRDLLFGFGNSLLAGNLARAQRQAEACWLPEVNTLACLSVRSGFDLVLQALALPPGSEVLVSAVTIPHMLEIIERHGLRARSIDVDPHTLAVDCRAVAGAINSRTRVLLLAHLWGSRMPLDEVALLAQRHGLVLIEDCAQVFDAVYRGHAASDICMWSFGPIKTATALGGALLRFRDRGLLAAVRRRQAAYPVQSRRAFARRIGRIAVLKLLAAPVPFGVLVAVCRARGVDHDRLIYHALRSFGGTDLLARLRQRPCFALLRLLARRVGTADPRATRRREQRARRLLAMLPTIAYPGAGAASHSHWMIPITSRHPDALVPYLWSRGFDATRHGSSLTAVGDAAGTAHVSQAANMLEHLVYLPVFPGLLANDTRRLCRAVLEFERDTQS